MIPDWAIYGFRLDHRSLWFQVDHTLNHICFHINHDHRKKLYYLYDIINDQSMINMVGR